MKTELPPEVVALQDGNKRRLQNLAEAGMPLDLRWNYLTTLIETVADHLGVLAEAAGRHEQNVSEICDEGEKAAEKMKSEEIGRAHV